MAAISACAQFIREVMDRKGLKQLTVAQVLGQTSNGAVRGVIKGLRPLPLEAVEAWVKALELSTEEARAFRRLAIRFYAPRYVQDLVDELDTSHEQLEELRKIVRALEERRAP